MQVYWCETGITGAIESKSAVGPARAVWTDQKLRTTKCSQCMIRTLPARNPFGNRGDRPCLLVGKLPPATATESDAF